jgi:hypothetical protein
VPFNGSGTFIRAFNWVTDKINGVNITASRMDGDSDGFAAGLTNCLTRDGQGKATATQSPATDATYDLGAPSLQWRNAYLSGTLKSVDDLQPTLRLLKAAQQTVTNSATAVADSTLVFTPVTVGSYIIEARMCFTANVTSGPGGIRVGLFASFINGDHQGITAYGFINNAAVTPVFGSYASTVAGTPSFSFATAANAGAGANWIVMTATINILNVTGAQQIGVNWCQNTATPGGSLIAETPSYMTVTRVS